MRCDDMDNSKKLRSFMFIAVSSKNKNEKKTELNGYSDFEESLFYNKSILVITIIKTIIMTRAKTINSRPKNFVSIF